MKIFCDSGCAESWREDRRCGLIYGQIRIVLDAHHYIDADWYPASVVLGLCPYCGREVVGQRREEPLPLLKRLGVKHAQIETSERPLLVSRSEPEASIPCPNWPVRPAGTTPPALLPATV